MITRSNIVGECDRIIVTISAKYSMSNVPPCYCLHDFLSDALNFFFHIDRLKTFAFPHSFKFHDVLFVGWGRNFFIDHYVIRFNRFLNLLTVITGFRRAVRRWWPDCGFNRKDVLTIFPSLFYR